MTRPGTFVTGDDPRRNLKGRPPRKSMTAHLEEALTDDARKKIAEKVREKAKAGDLEAIKWLADRLDGKVPNRTEITGGTDDNGDEKPIPIRLLPPA